MRYLPFLPGVALVLPESPQRTGAINEQARVLPAGVEDHSAATGVPMHNNVLPGRQFCKINPNKTRRARSNQPKMDSPPSRGELG